MKKKFIVEVLLKIRSDIFQKDLKTIAAVNFSFDILSGVFCVIGKSK